METRKGELTALSQKTKGVCIDGQWFSTAENIHQYIGKLNKGEVEFKISDDLTEIVFIKNTNTNSAPEIKKANNYVPTSANNDLKLASMCVSYAKDLAMEGKIEVEDIAGKASGFMTLVKDLASGKEITEEPDTGIDEEGNM